MTMEGFFCVLGSLCLCARKCNAIVRDWFLVFCLLVV